MRYILRWILWRLSKPNSRTYARCFCCGGKAYFKDVERWEASKP